MKHFIAPIFFILLSSFLQAARSEAQGVSIVDCNGRTRAVRSSSTSAGNNVEIDVVSASGEAAEGVPLKLTNKSGKTLTAAAHAGTATFYNIDSGTWVLTSDSSNFFYTTISFSDFIPPGIFESFADTAAAVGAIAGGVVIYSVIKNSTDGNGGGGSNSSGGSGSNNCPACNPDAVAPSIPAF
jgi:hypothetical protein